MAEIRLKRIESLLRQEISGMIASRRIKDPRIEALTIVTDVELSGDMKYAKVWISFYGEMEPLRASVEALNHAAGFIQGYLAKRIRLRLFPRLTFLADRSIERGARISKILREVAT